MTDQPPTVTVAPVPALPPASPRKSLLDWIKQPGTQRGIGYVLAGLALAYFGHVEFGVPLLMMGLPSVLPDNSTDAIRTQDIANALAHAAARETR